MRTLLAKLGVVIGLSAGAVGCAGADWRGKYDEMSREREDLQRRNTQLEGQLAAADARSSALEREMSTRRGPKAGADKDMEVPDGLREKGISMRKRGDDTVLDLPSDVFFSSGSATLSKGGEKVLGQVVDVVKKHAGNGSLIRVEGHADSDPIKRTKSKYHCNWELSFDRAHAVVHYMIDKGMDPKQLACESYGEFHPQDAKNKAKNRRVEIVISR